MSETDTLIPRSQEDDDGSAEAQPSEILRSPQFLLLPLSFIVAFANTATSATSVFAFAQLLCKNPPTCDHHESFRFALAIAIATSSANVLGTIALFPLKRLSRRGPRAGLLIWLLVRFMSPVCLLVGVVRRSIVVALGSKVFESIASDNIFHFNQNAAFSQAGSKLLCDRLMAASISLYMAGVSISPFVGGLLGNIQWSFALSIVLFACAFLYVMVFVGRNQGLKNSSESEDTPPDDSTDRPLFGRIRRTFVAARQTIKDTVRPFHRSRRRLVIGCSLFMYNFGQCYAFEAILISNTLLLRFGPLQNGIVISSAHIASALMLLTLIVVTRNGQNRMPTLLYGIVSLGVYGSTLICLGFATSVVQIYTAAVFIAAGLAASYFLKAELIASVPQKDGQSAAAFGATMEIMASAIAPITMGHLQASWDPQRSLAVLGCVMFVSAALLQASHFL